MNLLRNIPGMPALLLLFTLWTLQPAVYGHTPIFGRPDQTKDQSPPTQPAYCANSVVQQFLAQRGLDLSARWEALTDKHFDLESIRAVDQLYATQQFPDQFIEDVDNLSDEIMALFHNLSLQSEDDQKQALAELLDLAYLRSSTLSITSFNRCEYESDDSEEAQEHHITSSPTKKISNPSCISILQALGNSISYHVRATTLEKRLTHHEQTLLDAPLCVIKFVPAEADSQVEEHEKDETLIDLLYETEITPDEQEAGISYKKVFFYTLILSGAILGIKAALDAFSTPSSAPQNSACRTLADGSTVCKTDALTTTPTSTPTPTPTATPFHKQIPTPIATREPEPTPTITASPTPMPTKAPTPRPALQPAPKICMVTLSTPDRESFSSLVATNQAAYAARHGYAYTKYHDSLTKPSLLKRAWAGLTGSVPTPEENRPAEWGKIIALQEQMANSPCDWFLWIDDDIVITNPDKPLADFIQEYGTNKDIIIAKDAWSHRGVPMNNGIFLIRNSAWSKSFLQTVWKHGAENNLLKRGESLLEQQAMINLTRNNQDVAQHFSIIEQREMNSFLRCNDYNDPPHSRWQPGDFAAHATGMALKDRKAVIEQLVQQGGTPTKAPVMSCKRPL